MHSRHALALLLLSLLTAVAFAGFMLAGTDGHAVPQVVDLYLVCQYARAMAEGHPFQYNPGEAPSTGATSLLHTVLLASGHLAGFRGEGLVAFAILSGAVFFVASVFTARRLGARLAGESEGLLCGSLVALGGPVVWGFLYGSDTGLFMLLSLLLFDQLLAEWRRPALRSTLVVGCLLALARPEGLVIGAAVGVAWILGPGRLARPRARAAALAPVASGLAVLALYYVLTGRFLGTSVEDKSLLPNYSLADAVALTTEYGVDVVRGQLLGLYPSQVPVGFARGWAAFYFPPLGLLAVLLVLARPPEGLAAPLRVWAGAVAAAVVLAAPNVFMGVHFNRYLLWALPTLLVLAAVGLSAAARLASRGDPSLERGLYRAGAGLWLVLAALSTARFAALYGEMSGEVYRRDWAVAQWLGREIREGRLPADVRIANVATSVEYLTGHRAVNLHGVTSPAFFGNTKAEREAGVFEALGRLPESERPPLLITTVSTQEANPSLRELARGEPLFRTTSLSDEILVLPLSYGAALENRKIALPATRALLEGLEEVDRLNVCDTRDEAGHGYSFSSHLGNLRLHGAVRIDEYSRPGGPRVVDAGRAILGHESFRVRTRPGRNLVVVMRTASSASANVLRAGGGGTYELTIPEARITVDVGGQTAARQGFRPAAGWDEQVLRIPGTFITGDETTLTLAGRYASFHYWFFQ